ncbi:estradiol 17-beta-dehydrogenase 11-like [Lutzomyia longipalpis]|uniref:estradiol 17-beta-dehydrogenase 11-like n=1 Tax=Lutzomyia longipalpis TaxID=7200 RepID=UPI0024840E87|nr:estradiol 17-beta-dehydrogenase 11-like [Lutzomyia longipalpis]
MESVLNVGREEYVASKKPGQSYINIQLRLLWYLLQFFYVVFIGSLQTVFEWILYGRSEKSLDGQLVLVTGGGNGLGRAICLELAKEKCSIAIADVDIGAAEKTASDLQSLGVKAKAYKVDVANYQEVLALQSQIQKDYGCVDILINNAGLVTKLTLLEGTPEDVQKVINVNIVSNFWTTRVFLRDMVAQKRGHIVGVSSTFGMYPSGRSILYSTTKYAVRGFMSCLGEEIRMNKLSDKIKTTCVYPLFISTRQDLMSALIQMKIFDKLVVMSPKYAAQQILNAIKKEKLHASIPSGVYTLSGLLAIMPRRILEKYVDAIIGDLPPIY